MQALRRKPYMAHILKSWKSICHSLTPADSLNHTATRSLPLVWTDESIERVKVRKTNHELR